MSQQSFGEKMRDCIDHVIASFFTRLGSFVGQRPRWTLLLSFLLAAVFGVGLTTLTTESRLEKLWVPQNTRADHEASVFLQYFDNAARFNQIIFQASEEGGNVLSKAQLLSAMKVHNEIESRSAFVDGEGTFDFVDLCVPSFGSCANGGTNRTVCQCAISSILGQWNFDVETLESDADWLSTLRGSQNELNGVLGKPVYDASGQLVAAQAFTINYLLRDRSYVENGAKVDPINSGWEKDVFLDVAGQAATGTGELKVDYFAARSFDDVFGASISADLVLVQISYMMVFTFLGATLGRVRCGTGSRWTLAQAGVFLVALSGVASFGLASATGLFYGPMHSLLPFVLLGIGVDDAFVIVNAFNRERDVSRSSESNADIAARCTRGLARAGASITVTSATDLVAFSISAMSGIPALASFCAYAAFGMFFLWLFSATFFSAALVLDERRQRDNRRELLFCITRNAPLKEDGERFEEGVVSTVLRKYVAPNILSKVGKFVVFGVFAALLAFGVYGATNLSVEDSYRSFIPLDSYAEGWIDARDELFSSRGNEVAFIFEGETDIYNARDQLATLEQRLSGYSEAAPYLAEPSSADNFRNVMQAYRGFVNATNATSFGGIPLAEDGWPLTVEDFASVLEAFVGTDGPGAMYAMDVAFSSTTNRTSLNAIKVNSAYTRLVKIQRRRQIDDAAKLIEAMDSTREMVERWNDLPHATVYGGEAFLGIESFKIIKRELFQNVGLAILSVSIIVLLTIGSLKTALLVTFNVACCMFEILGFMSLVGIVIDSLSVIYMVLAVGLSIDYSAHIAHSFMASAGSNRNGRATEALADIGSAVLCGATSTFLAVVVLLFSESYVFKVFAMMLGITVALGALHGLIALPVLLSTLGPEPFASAVEFRLSDNSSKDEVRDKAAIASGQTSIENTAPTTTTIRL